MTRPLFQRLFRRLNHSCNLFLNSCGIGGGLNLNGRLDYDDEVPIESKGDYVKFVTNDKKYVVHNTIKNLEEKMNRQATMKIHRSYIVNIQKVDDIRENGLFKKGTELPISKAKRVELIQRINII